MADHETDYCAFLLSVEASFLSVANDQDLFLTDADGLNQLYLDNLPSDERQTHNCHACRNFIRAYGGLVAITENGETIPAMWSAEIVPELYRAAVSALNDRVKKARVQSVFLTTRSIWGAPVTGAWSHIAVVAPKTKIYHGRVLTPYQAMAAMRERYRMVATALTEFTPAMLDEALRILKAAALARSERFVGPTRWLRQLHDRPKGRPGENVLWRTIAAAPEGYCHPRASVLGPLLNDIEAGLPFDEIKAKFDAMLDPLQYQRPQAAPTAGNIKMAEAIVAKLGIAPSLERRFARLDELQSIWRPTMQKKPADVGVFGHLTPKNSGRNVRPVALPSVKMTWEKFAGTVLPHAGKIGILVPASGNFIALTTAVNADAPPILKWDREDERNPVAWYVYPGGSLASQWGLEANSWATVNAVVRSPTLWGTRPLPFLDDGVILVINGAVDSNIHSGSALFPECLKDDLHAVRATIEAYSRAARLSGRKEASGCGYAIRKERKNPGCSLRVFVSGAWSEYQIDRWE